MCNLFFHILHEMLNAMVQYSSLMETLEVSKYEFSFCHQCEKFHVNLEDGLCKLCQNN